MHRAADKLETAGNDEPQRVAAMLRAEAAGVSTDPIPPEDLERASQFVRERGWVGCSPTEQPSGPGSRDACEGTGMQPSGGYTHEAAALSPDECREEHAALVEEAARLLPPFHDWPAWDDCGPTMKNLMCKEARTIMEAVAERVVPLVREGDAENVRRFEELREERDRLAGEIRRYLHSEYGAEWATKVHVYAAPAAAARLASALELSSPEPPSC